MSDPIAGLVRYGSAFYSSTNSMRFGWYGAKDDEAFWKPWPVDFAQRVYEGEGNKPRSRHGNVGVAVFGPEEAPWGSLMFTADVCGLSAVFLNDDGVYVVSYSFYGPRRRYLPAFRKMSEAELERRRDQVFMSHMTVRWFDGEKPNPGATDRRLKEVSVIMWPDGSAWRGVDVPPFHPMGESRTVTEHDLWPGLDIEANWLPLPAFGDWGEIMKPVREHHLAAFGVDPDDLPPLRPRN